MNIIICDLKTVFTTFHSRPGVKETFDFPSSTGNEKSKNATERQGP